MVALRPPACGVPWEAGNADSWVPPTGNLMSFAWSVGWTLGLCRFLSMTHMCSYSQGWEPVTWRPYCRIYKVTRLQELKNSHERGQQGGCKENNSNFRLSLMFSALDWNMAKRNSFIINKKNDSSSSVSNGDGHLHFVWEAREACRGPCSTGERTTPTTGWCS